MIIHLDTWACVVIAVILVACAVVMPILITVNAHRVNTGKEPLFKGKVRKIVILNKRVTERAYFDENYGWHTPTPVNSESLPPDLAQEKSVDFRKVGGKMLYTKSTDDELYDQLEVGRAYKVRIRDGVIDKLYERLPTVSLEK